MAMKPKQFLYILLVSCFLTLILFFVDEGRYSFDFLTKANELSNVIIFTLLFSVIPIVLCAILAASRFRKNSTYFALLGYIPVVALLAFALGAFSG
jgi:hypothetical protein